MIARVKKPNLSSLVLSARRRISSASSLQEEQAAFDARVDSINAYFAQPRFKNLKRPYSAESVATKQGSLPPSPMPSSLMADKLWTLLDRAEKDKVPLHTMGAIDPVQMTQMAKWLDVVYVSGWATSSVLTTAWNEVGPDLADYPYTTVPNQVQRLFRAQQHHDRKIYDERMSSSPGVRSTMEQIDYLRPIIADADTGHGGLSSVMKLVKLFAEAGASGIHLEDQLHGGKKLDILQNNMLLIARTDSESARLISSTVDIQDHPFILGTTKRPTDGKGLAQVLAEAEREGLGGSDLDHLEAEWVVDHPLCTFDQAVENAVYASASITDKEGAVADYLRAAQGRSNAEARTVAKRILKQDIYWDWDVPRTREGYYHYQGGLDAAIQRVNEFAPYADMLWLETKTPDLEQARSFARKIRERWPDKWLVYNLSPSFNWSAHGFTEIDLKEFIWNLGKEGFVLQLVSLAGLHSTAVVTAELAEKFKADGMLAYVNLIQQKEKQIGCDVLTHQKWSGANYVDRILS
ncbi:hypothetical protein FRB99_002131, partial [Tulasnella sp. 403]